MGLKNMKGSGTNQDGSKPPLGALGGLRSGRLVGIQVRPNRRFSSRQFYKYNRELEHDQYRKRSTGTTTRLRNEMYLFKGNIHGKCVHLKKQCWSDRNDELAFETCATQRECRASLQSHNHRRSNNVVVHNEN